jgi:protein-export membrane protein SecD
MAEKKTQHTQTSDTSIRIFHAIVIIAFAALVGYFVYTTTINEGSKYAFRFGLDLAGGSHLVYEADVSGVDATEVPDLMNVLRDVIERRVNVFGVSEPIVQVESSSFVSDTSSERLVVELPGVSDVEEAIKEIGRTPLLEFKLLDAALLEEANQTPEGETPVNPYIDTGLTGRYFSRAELVFGQGQGGLSNEPIVSITFNDEGAKLFEEITSQHVGEQLAIFLDGVPISSPRINEAISGGQAVISGNFTPEEARELVQNLNFGALPLPITLQSTQTIGASLGAEILDKGVKAGVIGLALVIAFMLIWYRLPGAVAGIALLVYTALMLALFKFIPVTLTAAGLAGFILSVGMAVDANVLVFERMKEEYLAGKSSKDAARIGFSRAWPAIRDGNATSIFSAIILFWFGTSIVKGFALVFGVGVLISMFTALSVTRTLLMALPEVTLRDSKLLAKFYGTGFQK